MAKPIINRGDPQHCGCPKCGVVGYYTSDRLAVDYITYYNEDGSMDGGRYSDSIKYINDGKKAFCTECDKPLGFNVK